MNVQRCDDATRGTPSHDTGVRHEQNGDLSQNGVSTLGKFEERNRRAYHPCFALRTLPHMLSATETESMKSGDIVVSKRAAMQHLLSTINYQLSTIYYLLSTVYYRLSSIYYLRTPTCYVLLLAYHYPRSTICNLRSTIYSLLCTICYLV